jgi:hypothetical protein
VRGLAATEARKRQLPSAQSAPTAEQMEQFIQDEAGLRITA